MGALRSSHQERAPLRRGPLRRHIRARRKRTDVEVHGGEGRSGAVWEAPSIGSPARRRRGHLSSPRPDHIPQSRFDRRPSAGQLIAINAQTTTPAPSAAAKRRQLVSRDKRPPDQAATTTPKKRDRREHQIDAGMMDAPGFEGGREKHGSGRQSTDSDRDPQKRSIIHRPALSANACAHVRASSRCSNESSKWTGGTGRIVLVAASASKRSGSSRPVESPKRVPGLRVGPAARTCSR